DATAQTAKDKRGWINIRPRHVELCGSLIDELHSIADRKDRFGCIVRNFDAKFFFEGHDQLDRVEAVCTKIVNEACAFGDLVGIYTQMFNNYFLDALCGIAHVGTSTCLFTCLPWLAACRIVIKL